MRRTANPLRAGSVLLLMLAFMPRAWSHLRPEKFPMDTIVFTGHMPLAELRRDKPREYEQLVASGRLHENLAEPQPEVVVKTIRFFAWIALATGFSIVVWIIYAMIFAYP